MLRSTFHGTVLAATVLLAAPGCSRGAAAAQGFGQSLGTAAQGFLSRGTGNGGTGGMLGQFAPSVSSAPAGNLGGLLGYCVRNDAVSDPAAASGTLSALNGRENLSSLPGYAQGQQGVLQTGNGNTLSMSSLGQQLRPRLCDMILSRVRGML